jgi:hypothetical protein
MIYDKMKDCFDTLEEKVFHAISHSDLKVFFDKLDSIEGPTLVCGVGGSSIVAVFLAKVLREKKHIITDFVFPRDLAYMDLTPYGNVIAVSYSGSKPGVEVCLQTNLKKYLLTGTPRPEFENIVYQMPKEVSYVSVSATIAPLTLILLWYLNDPDLVQKILRRDVVSDSDTLHYEVMSGYESVTAATLLESSIIEGGFGTCVVHDKYNYCHGRINITRRLKSDLIFFRTDSELDEMLKRYLSAHYDHIICLDSGYEDTIVNDYALSVLSLKLVSKIAENKGIDISDMNELPDNDVFYQYNGKL